MNSEEKKLWFVDLAAPARKRLKRIPQGDLLRLRSAIETMKTDPFQGDVRKLHEGLEGYRLRVGNWRIFFDIHRTEGLIVITAIERRTSTTY
jgi:mRNA interferase RelE/StbE